MIHTESGTTLRQSSFSLFYCLVVLIQDIFWATSHCLTQQINKHLAQADWGNCACWVISENPTPMPPVENTFSTKSPYEKDVLSDLWHYGDISVFLRILQKFFVRHRKMQKCHKYSEMEDILKWECQLKVVFPAWSWKTTCLSRRHEEKNCLLFWLVLCSRKLSL